MSCHAVVMIGHVGAGKSTLAEKVTGMQGISSSSSESWTTASAAYITSCGRLMLVDTPGANTLKGKLVHNVWIAYALNYAPVSLIMIVVKADTRIDCVVDCVRTYAERFQDLSELLGVCVTHMDTVTWAAKECLARLGDELGIEAAVFAGSNTPGPATLAAILRICKAPQSLRIDSDNFLKFFNISNGNLKIMKCVRDEVSRFQNMNGYFLQDMHLYDAKDQVDLVFEFQAFMTDEIIHAQKRVAEANSFTFEGDGMANEAGHIANLTNQLRAVLFDVRTLALGYQSQHGISELRRCPHCGLVWAKLDGCNGITVCGNVMHGPDVRNSSFGTLGTFAFFWTGNGLNISRTGSRAARSGARSVGHIGCGRDINWSLMAPVEVPAEFMVGSVATTDDVALIPENARPNWKNAYQAAASKCSGVKRHQM
mmetsp:Transcript_43268/g.119642  ORF Transcript_43268/g.119642 Transcript_43268/m.119642 type:complete len:426 (+) Transcript_43268:115-1392(+)